MWFIAILVWLDGRPYTGHALRWANDYETLALCEAGLRVFSDGQPFFNGYAMLKDGKIIGGRNDYAPGWEHRRVDQYACRKKEELIA